MIMTLLVAFQVTAVAQGPAPGMTSVTPNSLPAYSAGIGITVYGTNFVPGSTVQWNGSPVPTTFSSSGLLTAAIGASLLAYPGGANITVVNPGGAATGPYPS
jgi:hypothetical protein